MRTLLAALLTLAACAEDPTLHDGQDLTDEALAPPVAVPFAVSTIIDGATARMTVAELPPGTVVQFALSTRGVGRTCPRPLATCLNLASPIQRLGQATAGRDGIATFTFMPPRGLADGIGFAAQAVLTDPNGRQGVTDVYEGYTGLQGCPRIYMPVCGYDNVTYGNECEANVAGWPAAYAGPC